MLSMRKIIEKFLPAGLLFSLVFLSVHSYGQEGLVTQDPPQQQPEQQWEMSLEQLKSKAQFLLQENQKLQSEYQTLSEKINTAQGSIEQLDKDIDEQGKVNAKLKTMYDEKIKSTEPENSEVTRLKAEVADIEKANAKLRQDLAMAESAAAGSEKEMQALEAQKQTLSSEIQQRQELYQDFLNQGTAAFKDKKGQLTEFQKKEEELQAGIEGLEKKAALLPGKVDEMAKQNHQLEDEASALKRQKSEQERKNEVLRRENQKLQQTGQIVSSQIVRERWQLEREVKLLTQELDSARNSVQQSSNIIAMKRELMDKIMVLDAENQKLRDQVSQLMEEVKSKKQDMNL